MNRKVIKLDVREEIRRGREPFSKILQTARALKPNEDLLLIAPFEPAPLFAVLAREGFSHQAVSNAEGDWEIRFSRVLLGSAEAKRPSPSRGGACAGPPVVEVDARGLEPPQPLVKILEALESLPPGARLRARTDRRPMHLYGELEERGFTGRSEEQPDGSFITHVERR
jgi:uncharacterized protein (DUF2249 family)